MIIKLAKATTNTLDHVASFISEDRNFLAETFPNCSTRNQVIEILKGSPDRWSLLVAGKLIALFSM